MIILRQQKKRNLTRQREFIPDERRKKLAEFNSWKLEDGPMEKIEKSFHFLKSALAVVLHYISIMKNTMIYIVTILNAKHES